MLEMFFKPAGSTAEWEYVTGSAGGGVPTSEFILGTTKPTAANTGPAPGTVFTNSTTTLISASNITIENTRFTEVVAFSGQNVVVKNCIFQGVPGQFGGQNTGGVVRCTNSNVVNIRFENCLIKPASESSSSIGIVGHDFTLYRCDVSNTVDCVRIYDSADPDGPSGVKLWGSYLHDMSYWTPFAGHADNQTHNDGVQIEGGTGTDIFGCNISARASTEMGNSTQTQYPPYVLSCIIVTPNVGVCNGLRIRSNWFDGGYAPLNIVQKDKGPIYNLEIKDNRFSGKKGLVQDFLTEAPIKAANNNGADWTNNIREDTGRAWVMSPAG